MAVSINDVPDKLFLSDYGGNYSTYIDAVYSVFEKDFIRRKAYFGSWPLQMKVHLEFQDRAYTFYHMTHKGNVENERVPDFRRCERMPWAKPTVEILPQKGEVKCWEQTRSGKHRVCIWLEVDDGDNYFVVLDVRKTFVLLWTAFYADYPHQVRKKAKEYEEWLRLSGRVLTPDELIKNIMQRIND